MTALSNLRVELLDPAAGPALQAFLSGSDEATVFHTTEWHQVIRATYSHKCYYWVAWSRDRMVGIFPVVAVSLPLMGTKMVAMPYQFHSGMPIGANETVQAELVGKAVDHACKLRANYFEIRHYGPAPFLAKMGFVSVDSQLVTTFTPLEGLELKRMLKGHREFVYYAEKRGVRIVEGKEWSHLRTFHCLYLIEGRKLGSPLAGWKFFENLHRVLRPYYRLSLAYLHDRCLGALLTLDNGNTIFARCIAGNFPESRKLHINKALLWRAMSEAAQRKCQSFNWGISWCRDNGLIAFKEGWNGTTRPVYQYVYPIHSKPPVPGGYFEGFSLAKAVWRKLPLPVVDWAGHRVTRWVC